MGNFKKQLLKKWTKRKKIIYISLFIISLVVILFYKVKCDALEKKNEKKETVPTISRDIIETKIESINELAGAKMTYRDLYKYVNGDIALINKKEFIMTYTAEIKAGINISDIDIDLSNDKITLKVPKAKILSIHVDPKSIEFYAEKDALFNQESRNDTKKALKAAEKEAKKIAKKTSILKDADNNTKRILTGVLTGIKTSDGKYYEIVIKEKTQADTKK